jgi:hypothetical protein
MKDERWNANCLIVLFNYTLIPTTSLIDHIASLQLEEGVVMYNPMHDGFQLSD